MTALCYEFDDYIQSVYDGGKAIWVATIWDRQLGERQVYQDDNRPGLDEPSAWVRLGNLIHFNSFTLRGLSLCFRGNEIILPSHKDGYYFVQRAGAVWGSDQTDLDYVAGFLEDDKIKVGIWRTPTLSEIVSLDNPQIRDPADAGKCLIYGEAKNRKMHV